MNTQKFSRGVFCDYYVVCCWLPCARSNIINKYKLEEDFTFVCIVDGYQELGSRFKKTFCSHILIKI